MSASPIELTALSTPGGELTADTAAGAAMVATAERVAADFGPGAVRHDGEASFAHEHLDALRHAGFLAAPIPRELGGGDVLSVHDVVVASSRLARTDPATTIGVNMHLAVVMNVVRNHQVARSLGDHRRAEAVGEQLRLLVESGAVFASPVSERSPQDLTRPSTRATRTDDGWVIEGHKAFATMASAADLLSVAVTYDRDGEERYGFAIVPAAASGVDFHDDWDALGMRASASGSVSFHGVVVAPGAVRDGFPAGVHSPDMLDRYLTSGALHAAASLGIAEAAHDHIAAVLRGRAESVVHDPFTVVRLSENAIDLAAMRASLDRAARCIDAYLERHPTGTPELEDVLVPHLEVQASKTFLNAAAVRVVDRALALSGGAGFMATHPLAKAWRDVRAGGFMHPVGANRVDVLLARGELGLGPA